MKLFAELCLFSSLHFEVVNLHAELCYCNTGLRLFKEAKDRDSHGKVGRFNIHYLVV